MKFGVTFMATCKMPGNVYEALFEYNNMEDEKEIEFVVRIRLTMSIQICDSQKPMSNKSRSL